jgi:phosphatidylinositol alpha-1,6-mannosyltransferase
MIWIQKVFATKSKTLCILHGSEVNLSNLYLRKFTHYSIAQFQTIVSVSLFTQRLLPNWILKTHQNLKIIPNGLDKSDFTLTKSEKLIGEPALLTVGHVSPRKGQHRLVKALPQIIEKYPNVHYHIVGRPIGQKRLELMAESLNVKEYVTFHGSVKNHKDLWDYYSAADIFILLSENQSNGDVEGFGIVALEANACGTPVVGAKYCGVEEAVSHKESGYLVDGSIAKEIIDGIEFCIQNKVILKRNSISWANKHAWPLISEYFKTCL